MTPSDYLVGFVAMAIAIVTILAVGSLVFSGVRQSLLASPDMSVEGPGTYGNRFHWFLDRVGSTLPDPFVISLPMWVFRAVMFAWALWIALALLRWLRGAWKSWKTNGIWKGRSLDPGPAPREGTGLASQETS